MIAGRGNGALTPEARQALRRLVDRERRRALLVDALAHGDRRLAMVAAMAERAGIRVGEAEREARRRARGNGW